LTHYQAIAQILEAQLAYLPAFDYNNLSTLQVSLLDATLYHLSTRLILEEDVDPIYKAFPTETLTKYIRAVEEKEKTMWEEPLILPVLGRTPPSLFVQILRLTWLSRQPSVEVGESRDLINQVVAGLNRMQQRFQDLRQEDTLHSPDDQPSSLSNSAISARLFYLCTRILCAKVADPRNVTSQSPSIRVMFRKACTLLRLYDSHAPCGQFTCWPLLILGCVASPRSRTEADSDDLPADAIYRRQARERIHETLLNIWNISYSGYVQRTLSALNKIWTLPRQIFHVSTTPDLPKTAGFDAEYDGLDALLYKDGLGAGLFLVDDG
jgi:hypothetical protein